MALIQCPECGQTVSDQASACIKCGYSRAPFGGAHEHLAEAPQSETCLIRWNAKMVGGAPTWKDQSFWADAIHPVWGQYNAGESDKFNRRGVMYGGIFDPGYEPRGDIPGIVAAHDKLVNQLTQDGWNSTDAIGNRWWERGFRRRVPSTFETKEPTKLFADQRGLTIVRELPKDQSFRVVEVLPDRKATKIRLEDGTEGFLITS